MEEEGNFVFVLFEPMLLYDLGVCSNFEIKILKRFCYE